MKAIARQIDSRGRLTLGTEFANRTVLVNEVSPGVVQVTAAEVVPSREAWLFKNPKALEAVLAGIEQVKARRVSKGPDLAKGARLAERIEE